MLGTSLRECKETPAAQHDPAANENRRGSELRSNTLTALSQVDSMSTPAELSREILRVSIAQICADIGFTAIQKSALDTFTDVTLKCTYLHGGTRLLRF